jgi:hypothetical protein
MGGSRWAGCGRFLTHEVWSAHVLTSAGEPKNAASNGVTVRVAQRSRAINDTYGMHAQGRPAGAAGPPLKHPWFSSGPGFLVRFHGEIAAWLIFRDHWRGWLLRAANREHSQPGADGE